MGSCHHSPWASNFNGDSDFHDGNVDDDGHDDDVDDGGHDDGHGDSHDTDDCDENLMSVPPQRNAPFWRRATIQGNSPFTVPLIHKY